MGDLGGFYAAIVGIPQIFMFFYGSLMFENEIAQDISLRKKDKRPNQDLLTKLKKGQAVTPDDTKEL